MRLQITHLKAPWPLGAVVGDVLELDAVPTWAVGKCKQAGDDAELTIITGDGSGEGLPPIGYATGGPVAAGAAGCEKEGVEVFVVNPADGINPVTIASVVTSELEAAAKADKKAAAEAKAEAAAKAEALGIDVDKRWSTARILEEIAKK